jgi:hypothetical protein
MVACAASSCACRSAEDVGTALTTVEAAEVTDDFKFEDVVGARVDSLGAPMLLLSS